MKKVSFVSRNHEFYKMYGYLYLFSLAFGRVRIVALTNKLFLKFSASFLSFYHKKQKNLLINMYDL